MNASLTLTRTDYERLSHLILSAPEEIAELLEGELARANVVDDTQLPLNVVAMNSAVRYRVVANGQENEITLVYPADADSATGRISVLAPIGAALIGLSVGQKIKWPLPQGGHKEIEVLSVRRVD
ncbi:MAG: nucleoside diphosphate kinase regulator [Bdellovibrionaceae bacterium]|nr:nucleoside diphosphate kinase regulator [Pseudobdellovibrionaceae bacterium]